MKLMPLLYRDYDRHGNLRYWARAGDGKRRKVRIRSTIGDPGFMTAYLAAVAELGSKTRTGGPELAKPHTLNWLAAKYFGSIKFRGYDPRSQRTRAGVINSCLREPLAPGDKATFADLALRVFTSRHVRVLRDRKESQPGAANNRKKYLSAMFEWGMESLPEVVTSNPCKDVKKIDYDSDGFRPWTEEDLDRFEVFYPIGSKQRLALALFLYTGARISDVYKLGPANVRSINGERFIVFVPRKTKRHRKQATPKPYLPELARIVDATKVVGRDTFLVTEHGKPHASEKAFGNWWADQCDRAGLTECRAHGLRKLGAVRLAMGGATHFQLMHVFDWSNPAQAQVYIRLAEGAKGAAVGMPMLAQRGV